MDTAHKALLERAPAPTPPRQPASAKPQDLAATKPELNRQERLISTAYLAMIVMIVTFLAVTGLMAWLGT